MINIADIETRIRSPLTGAPAGGTLTGITGQLTVPPSRVLRRRSLARFTVRAGVCLFAATDAEACWRAWEIHQRWLGLRRSYRDPRFRAATRTCLAGSHRPAGG